MDSILFSKEDAFKKRQAKVDAQRLAKLNPTKVLVVGAGSVGKVLALALTKGGCELTFLVKDGGAKRLEGSPVRLHWLSMVFPWRGEEGEELVSGYSVCVWGSSGWKDKEYDVVYITTDATAMMEGDWMSELAEFLSREVKPIAL